MAINRIAFFLILITHLAHSQNRYFVSFKDKVNTPYSVNNPLQFLSQKSIDRRSREGFSIIEEDLPVDPNYVNQVKQTGASTFFTSRWFNGVLIQTATATAAAVAGLPFVSKVELVAPGTILLGGREGTIDKFEHTTSTSIYQNQMQLGMIGLDQMQTAGYHGEGVDVAVFDGGFIGANTLSAFQALYQEGRVKAVFSFVNNTPLVYSATDHGTQVLSIMAGSIGNSYQGGVVKANYSLYQTEDISSEYRVEEYNWLFAAERADSAGIDVINSSLGYNTFDDPSMNYTYQNLDGKTAVSSRAARMAVLRGILVANSAGNEGGNSWNYVDVPADADGVLASGSVNYSGLRSSFSSEGPTADGRIKPDVCALGENASVIIPPGTISSNSGTSFASPLIACLAVGLRQALPQASAREIYIRIINSASQANTPDNLLGYGIPNFTKAQALFDFTDEFQLYPNPVGDNGQLKVIFKDPQGQNFTVMILNLAGQKVFEVSDMIAWSNNPYSLDLSGLSNGLYLVRVETSAMSKTVKIIK